MSLLCLGERRSRDLGSNVQALCCPNKSSEYFVLCTHVGIFAGVYTDTYTLPFKQQEKNCKFFLPPFFPHLLC